MFNGVLDGVAAKVAATVIGAGILAGATAVVNSAVNSVRLSAVEQKSDATDDRQRAVLQSVTRLEYDMSWTRAATARLLRKQGIDPGSVVIQSGRDERPTRPEEKTP